tara:strand:+ start:438 stop:665 length:228 start_codon:yes stop_codon:yes gene_type:complete
VCVPGLVQQQHTTTDDDEKFLFFSQNNNLAIWQSQPARTQALAGQSANAQKECQQECTNLLVDSSIVLHNSTNTC